MNEELRARVGQVLAAAGIAGAKDTTTRMRPQWRASFSWSGQIHGEKGYLHIYVPAGIDQLQVNCTAPSPALDPAEAEWLQDETARFNASHCQGTPEWEGTIGQLGASPNDVAEWVVLVKPYQGLQHRMVLARVTMPLDSLSGGPVALGIKLGFHLARTAREELTTDWNGSNKES